MLDDTNIRDHNLQSILLSTTTAWPHVWQHRHVNAARAYRLRMKSSTQDTDAHIWYVARTHSIAQASTDIFPARWGIWMVWYKKAGDTEPAMRETFIIFDYVVVYYVGVIFFSLFHSHLLQDRCEENARPQRLSEREWTFIEERIASYCCSLDNVMQPCAYEAAVIGWVAVVLLMSRASTYWTYVLSVMNFWEKLCNIIITII